MGNVLAGHRWGAAPWKSASLSLMAAVVLLLLSVASASASSIDLPAGTSAEGVEAAAVSSYQDDFEVSQQTAEANLETQEDGAGIVEALEKTQGNAYAGVWFDNESGEFVVPVLTPAESPEVGAALDGSDLSAADFRTKPVESSWGELEAAQGRIDETLLPLIEEGLVGTSIDPRTNAVVVTLAAASSSARRSEVQAAAGGESVEVEVRESQESRLGISLEACNSEGGAHCDAPMRGGVNIVPHGALGGSGCTAGFKGIGDTYGSRFVLTAGHCVAGINKWDSFTAAPEERQEIGQTGAYSFPGHDYAAINANGSYWDKPSWPVRVLYWGVNQEFPINYESSSYIGELVCHVGQQSGRSCGTVTAMHLTEPIENKPGEIVGYLNNITRFNEVCAHEGDSGGPVFTPGNVALGIYSGSDKPKGALNDCYWSAYYTEITEDTDLLGIHVAPRIPPPPPNWKYENLGGTLTSDPDPSSWGKNNLNVFARGTDAAIWRRSFNGSSWTSWESTGCCIVSGPSAVSWSPGRIDVVGRINDNSIGHWWTEGGPWYYDNLGGTFQGDPTIVSGGYNNLSVFARGTDNAIYRKTWNGTWSPWANSGCCITSSPAAVSWGGWRYDVVARVSGNTVGHWYSADGGAHVAYDNLGGTFQNDLDIASPSSERLDVFGTDSNGYIWHKWWTGVAWSEWAVISGPVTGGVGAVEWGTDRIDVFGRDANGALQHWLWSP